MFTDLLVTYVRPLPQKILGMIYEKLQEQFSWLNKCKTFLLERKSNCVKNYVRTVERSISLETEETKNKNMETQ